MNGRAGGHWRGPGVVEQQGRAGDRGQGKGRDRVGRKIRRHLVQVVSAGGAERVVKDLDLLDDGEVVVVGSHADHEAVLHVERDLSGVPVLADERVEGVRVWHPANQAAAGQQRGKGAVSGDRPLPQ